MLFSKKPRKKTINLARLSEAISVHNGDISLITYAGELFEPEEIPATYSINENLSLTVRDFSSPTYKWLGNTIHLGNSFSVDLYVENIKMNSFTFFVDRDPFPNNKIPVRPWRCTSEKTYHEMPEQFVDAINKWSYDILAQFEKESKEYNEKKAQHERSQYEEEEQRLQMYR